MSITRMQRLALVVLALCATAAIASAADVHVGQLTIQHPWIRPTGPGAPTAAGYVTLINRGNTPDRLIGAASAWAAQTELHQSVMAHGVMIMQALPGGVAIPAGGSVSFRPESYHIMFIHPSRRANVGEHIRVVLTFAHAGRAAVDFVVEAGGAAMPGMPMGHM
jgi:periplasmic copper chaperone A